MPVKTAQEAAAPPLAPKERKFQNYQEKY